MESKNQTNWVVYCSGFGLCIIGIVMLINLWHDGYVITRKDGGVYPGVAGLVVSFVHIVGGVTCIISTAYFARKSKTADKNRIK
jgi:hypothetical protein